MYSLVLAAMMVCQTPDFSSTPRIALANFSSVTTQEIPPTAEIESVDCPCGGDCHCNKCKVNMARILGLEEEVKRLTAENAQLKKVATQDTKPVANTVAPLTYYLKDVWGYEWQDTDKTNLIRYVDDLNCGKAGHPHYNEIVLKHQSYSLPQTYSFSAGGCSGGSCGRSSFGGFR